jgi:hypothetical protein
VTINFIYSRDLCSTALKMDCIFKSIHDPCILFKLLKNFMKPCLKHYKNISYNVLKNKISYKILEFFIEEWTNSISTDGLN